MDFSPPELGERCWKNPLSSRIEHQEVSQWVATGRRTEGDHRAHAGRSAAGVVVLDEVAPLALRLFWNMGAILHA